MSTTDRSLPQFVSNSFTTVVQVSSSSNSPVNLNTINDPYWQEIRSTIRERNAVMFNNELMADVHFLVGSPGKTEKIPAHKYILAIGSSVFYTMFYGALPEQNDTIEILDVEPSAFRTLLKYLYSDDIDLESNTVLATLNVAKKYLVPYLAHACVTYLGKNLNEENACFLLSQSKYFEEPDLMQRCWEVIDAQAEMVLKSEDFVNIDINTLESMLKRETLNCKEIHLFKAAINWATAECHRKELEPTSQNIRAVLGNVIYLIRLPTIGLDEFANTAVQLGILTSQETIDIFLYFMAKNKPHLDYLVKPRTGLKPQICHRFRTSSKCNNQWRYRGRCDSIQFSVDKRIFIIGFGLYGSPNERAEYNAKIELKYVGSILAQSDTNFLSDGSSNTFRVYFEHPIQIEPGQFYTASVTLDGTELSYFGQEGMSTVTTGCITFQFQCSSESTNGTAVRGGQIPELIFYGTTVQTTCSFTRVSEYNSENLQGYD
ncbi:hypothetical protein PGB90_006053 [Kerria lacca]